MDLLTILNNIRVALGQPSVFIFLSVGIILTFKLRFLQIRGISRFFSFLKEGMTTSDKGNMKTISSLHAMFASMATTLGMGNIIGPSIAIILGGPGALFWLIVYMFFGGIVRFTEVTLALQTRKKTEQGDIISGPIQYLKLVSRFISGWYGVIMVILFAIWSAVQSNTLANIMFKEHIPKWIIGLALATIVMVVLHGGAKRVGLVASKLVPIMCFAYLSFAILIIFHDVLALKNALYLIFSNIFTPRAVVLGFVGGTIFSAMREGIYRSIFITEAGLGTSSIPHSMSDVKCPTDQGLLAMYSIVADAILSFISGLLVIVTGIWATVTQPDATLVYEVFKMNSPILGKFVLIFSVTLFVLTTIIGNSFNGTQSFASFTNHKYLEIYKICTAIVIFAGALIKVPIIWALVDVIITFVAVPNVISLVILAFRRPDYFKIKG